MNNAEQKAKKVNYGKKMKKTFEITEILITLNSEQTRKHLIIKYSSEKVLKNFIWKKNKKQTINVYL